MGCGEGRLGPTPASAIPPGPPAGGVSEERARALAPLGHNLLIDLPSSSVLATKVRELGGLVGDHEVGDPHERDELPHELSAELEALVRQCLAKDPTQRPRSARALRQALGRLSPEARGLLASMARASEDTRRAYQAVSFLTQQRLADILLASEARTP